MVDFFQRISDKKYWKKCYLDNSIPLPLLNNVEKQRAKVASSYVMGFRYCVGGEGEF